MGTRTHLCTRQASSEMMVGGLVEPHVHLVFTYTAPRAALLFRFIFVARASVLKLHDAESDTRRAAGAEVRSLVRTLLNSTDAVSGVRDAGAAFRGTPLRSVPPLPGTATVPQRLVSRLFSGRLTALHRRNHQDYVNIMLAAKCLLFAAVCTGTEFLFYFK